VKLVRRKRRRKPRLCVYIVENYLVIDWFPSRPCKPGKKIIIPDGVEPCRPLPRKRLIPRKGRPLVFLPPGWEQLTFPFPRRK
jgi:hypothetical protein